MGPATAHGLRGPSSEDVPSRGAVKTRQDTQPRGDVALPRKRRWPSPGAVRGGWERPSSLPLLLRPALPGREELPVLASA